MMSDMDTSTTRLSHLDDRTLALLKYWDALRGDRVVPGRVEISPPAITGHLSRVCILERPKAGTVRMRLAGATLSGRMGMELRGMPFRALFDLDHRALAMDAAETAIVTPAVSVLTLARAERHGSQHEARMIILPLSDTRGGLTRAIALYSEAPSVTPIASDLRGRFQVTDQWSLEIPETGYLPGLSKAVATVGKTTTAKPKPVRIASRQSRASIAAPRVEAREMPNHTRPVFQVIDGGLA